MKFRTKLLFVMKLTTALILFAAMHVYAKTSGQIVSYSARNAKLEQVFRALEQQTGYGFFYQVSDLKNAQPVSVDFKNLALPDALRMILKDQTLNFFIDGKTVFITPKKKEVDLAQGLNSGLQSPPKLIDVRGKVVDEEGKAIAGASVVVKGSTRGVSTNENGEFELNGVDGNATLVISGVNIERFEVKVNGRGQLGVLKTTEKISELADVTISAVNTGYQQIPKERATGSYVLIDSTLLNRSVSTNILDRLEGVANGLAFNKNINPVGGAGLNNSTLTIRGRTTINSNPEPLIIVDNFPYDGALNTINPDDVESITVLKDAAAAAIWGAFSGNGVIVITTKKGRLNQPLKVTLNTWINIGNKPDIYYAPYMNASQYIDVEKFLFSKGLYTSAINNQFTFVSPVVDVLARRAAGQISVSDSANLLSKYAITDTRDDISRYMYQKSVSEHYDLSFTGGGLNNKYYFSAGFDNNRASQVGNRYKRAMIRASNTYLLFNQKLELTAGIQFQQSGSEFNAVSVPGAGYPYIALKDADGTELVVPTGYRQRWKDTAGQGKLLNWGYRPFDELDNSDNSNKLIDYHIDIAAKYKILPGFTAEVYYNYNTGNSESRNYYNSETYFARNLINSYSQINFATGAITRPIPAGGILDKSNRNYVSSNLRVLLNYTRSFGDHTISALAGSELRKLNSYSFSNRLYGYDEENTVALNVDYVGQYPNYVTKSNAVIPSNISNLNGVNNFISNYGLLGYTYKSRYALTVSGRRDESNIYGVKANMKGVPLYSAGASWEINREKFYNVGWLPYLKLRVTAGYQGNSNTSVAALTTIRYSTAVNSYGAAIASLTNIPNPSLRWEKVRHINIGLDFSTKNNRINGSAEYFLKNGLDLISTTPVDPTRGVESFSGNTASISATGFDLILNSKNISTLNFQWSSTVILNYAIDKVTEYLPRKGLIGTYTGGLTINPNIGFPLYSVYAYRWAGLDSAGNPQGILDGKISQNYPGFISSANFDNLRYMGSVNPPVFGSVLNKLSYKQLSFSFLLTYKFGHYFRRPSIKYNTLFALSGGIGDPDYALRWQKTGDEKVTNVPSVVYPVNANRDIFYTISDILVEKGDFIRLQDIQLSYSITSKLAKKLGIQSAVLYGTANNIGILWRANKYGIDPDVVPSSGLYTIFPNPKTFSFGLKVGL